MSLFHIRNGIWRKWSDRQLRKEGVFKGTMLTGLAKLFAWMLNSDCMRGAAVVLGVLGTTHGPRPLTERVSHGDCLAVLHPTADPGGANEGHVRPPKKPKLYAPPKKKKKKEKKRKEKKRKEKKRKEKKRKEKKRKEKKRRKKRGKKRDKTKPHNFTPPPCAAKSCLYVQLLLKYANYNTLIGYMNVFIILLTIQHCHKICNGSLCS